MIVFGEGDMTDASVELFDSVKEADFDAHVINGYSAAINAWHANSVFLSGHNGIGSDRLRFVNDIKDFLLRKSMVVSKTPAFENRGAEFFE